MTNDGGPRRRAIFRADASAAIGGGHVMRCLTLADGLIAKGWCVGFICTIETLSFFPALANRVEVLHAMDWRFLDAASLTQCWPTGCDVLVVDHYDLDSRFETACRGWAAKIVVINDLADRRHDCDLLIDPTLGRRAEDYRDLVPDHALVLPGPDFALLRPEFAARRAEALAGRANIEQANRVLVSLGFTDLGGISARVTRGLLDSGLPLSLDVVIGPNAPSQVALEELASRDARLTLHVAPAGMAALMVRAHLAIGAGGTTSWERCCLGLPTVIVVLAANQRVVASSLELAGAAVVAEITPGPNVKSIVECASDLIRNPSTLLAMSRAAASLVDGRGRDRVLQVILSLRLPTEPQDRIVVRPATTSDSRSVFEWRNDPVSRANSHTGHVLGWDEHDEWFSRSLVDPDRVIFMGVVDDEPIGVVRFDRCGTQEFEISINLAPGRRGRGLGAKLLSSACSAFTINEPKACLAAQLKVANLPSRRVFEACGFEFVSEANGMFTYRRRPHDQDPRL